jgi:FKBP-type peptidyl-prolyl cis-trans isomerase FkpA
MRKLLPLCMLAILTFVSCVKNNQASCNYTTTTIIAPDAEQQAMQDSLSAHNITASMNPEGFFYTINSQGSAQSISNLCTTVSVEYKAGFFNGKIFDSTATGTVANFQLGAVIPGWQKGVPLVGKGGSITLYIPPSLGYAANNIINTNTGDTIIPANSYLVFNVHLVDFQ